MQTDRLAEECHGYDLDGNPLPPAERVAAGLPIVARDLCDMGATAGQIARDLQDIGESLGRAHEEGEPMPPQIINNLWIVQARIGALILELEAEAKL